MKHLRKLLFLLPLSLLLIGCGNSKTNGSTTKKDDNTTTKSDSKTTKEDKTTTKKTTTQQTTTKDDSEQEYNFYHVFDLNGVEVVKDKKYYAPGSSLTVTNSYSYDCYDFEGYYLNGEKVSSTRSANIDTNLTGDTKIIAKFVPKSEMAIYEFTYEKVDDKEIITIIDVIDETRYSYVVPWYVTNISFGAFNGCSIMRSIELPFCGAREDSNEFSSEHLLGTIFGNKEYEGSKKIQQSFKTSNSVTSATFYFPENLCNIRISRGPLYYGALSNLGSLPLNKLYLDKEVSYLDVDTFTGTRNFQSISVSTQHELYKSNSNNTYIMEIATDKLIYVSNVASVTLPSTLKIIGRSAFQSNNQLEELVLPEGVVEIENAAFNGAKALKNITLPSGIKKIGKIAFINATSLETINLPDSIEYIGTEAFYGCDSLNIETLVLPLNLIEVGSQVIYNNPTVKNIVVNKNLVKLGSQAFAVLDKLEGVYYNGTIDDYLKIEFESNTSNFIAGSQDGDTHPIFYFLDATGDVEFNGNKYSKPTKITIDAEKVNNYLFLGMDYISEVKFSDNVKEIGEMVFAVTGTRSFIIPKSVTKIGSKAFNYNQVHDTSFFYEGTQEEWNSIDKKDTVHVMYYYSDDEPSTDRAHYWHYDDDNNPKTWQ